MRESVIWSPGQTLDLLEKEVIVKAFRFYHGNKTATSNSLGISIRTLENKLEKYESEAMLQDAVNERLRKEREYFLARSRGIPVDPLEPEVIVEVKAPVLDIPPPKKKAAHSLPDGSSFVTPSGRTVKL